MGIRKYIQMIEGIKMESMRTKRPGNERQEPRGILGHCDGVESHEVNPIHVTLVTL